MTPPHFLDASSKLLEMVDGLNPDPEKHGSIVHIQPVSYSSLSLCGATASLSAHNPISPFASCSFPCWNSLAHTTQNNDTRILKGIPETLHCYTPTLLHSHTHFCLLHVFDSLLLILNVNTLTQDKLNAGKRRRIIQREEERKEERGGNKKV